MKSEQFTHSIRRKRVVSTDGKIIGQIKNITFDRATGQLINLVVRPDQTFDASGYKQDGGVIYLPFEAVKDITDFIVVDRFMLR
ncbi:MAG TPA: PRC-barrel domain-containing protein [Methanocorpusculum sp.]|nr:PRC-barrel domain-containing protein [Methanocorpusculum sp.]HJJ89487.1 PRC-barrel domain-containing protein [Methanocorpusculum sp.]HJJ90730.1 PRC-barrel domain-containing protein [Methanocorpusculum sp.]HJK00883.1 PRC-barrel domain-containing protein [Methanocorpusculum sp.]HJK02494.1 PRC-barrel domain-containing protein [Methanocorpusculum sp.]